MDKLKLKLKQKLHTMKQCTTNEDEIEVANILLDLPNLIPETRRRSYIPVVSWGIKKKRSVPSPREEITRPKVKVESTSPSTPLCFYPSESDDKSKHPYKINLKKRTREELLEMIDGLTRTRESMRVEVENERNRYKKLKSLNLSLKEKKQEVNIFGLKKEKPQLEQQHNQNPPMFAHYHQQQQLMINNCIQLQASGRFKFPNHDQVPLGHVGPLGIPDLNVGLEEAYGLECFQPLDRRSRVFMDERVMCATQARRRRMVKIKEIKKRQQHQRVR